MLSSQPVQVMDLASASPSLRQSSERLSLAARSDASDRLSEELSAARAVRGDAAVQVADARMSRLAHANSWISGDFREGNVGSRIYIGVRARRRSRL